MFKKTYSFTGIFRYIGLIGDSLSSGEFEILFPDGSRSYTDKIEYSWGQYIARKNGNTVYNFTRGGMTAREYNDSFADEHDFYNPKYKSQAYIIALGVNDIINDPNHVYGGTSDIDFDDYNKNKKTFIGEYAKIIQKYKEISKDAKFFLVTMPKVRNEDPEVDALRKEFSDVIRKISKVFSNTYVLDLYNDMEPFSIDTMNLYFMNGHMNPMGYIYTADVIDQMIDQIIENNPKDFELVGMTDLVKTGL